MVDIMLIYGLVSCLFVLLEFESGMEQFNGRTVFMSRIRRKEGKYYYPISIETIGFHLYFQSIDYFIVCWISFYIHTQVKRIYSAIHQPFNPALKPKQTAITTHVTKSTKSIKNSKNTNNNNNNSPSLTFDTKKRKQLKKDTTTTAITTTIAATNTTTTKTRQKKATTADKDDGSEKDSDGDEDDSDNQLEQLADSGPLLNTFADYFFKGKK